MTPKEKAIELVDKFKIGDVVTEKLQVVNINIYSKLFALRAVDEILLIAPEMHMEGFGNLTIREYYKKVKQEIEKL
jgi:hypothetical protein